MLHNAQLKCQETWDVQTKNDMHIFSCWFQHCTFAHFTIHSNSQMIPSIICMTEMTITMKTVCKTTLLLRLAEWNRILWLRCCTTITRYTIMNIWFVLTGHTNTHSHSERSTSNSSMNNINISLSLILAVDSHMSAFWNSLLQLPLALCLSKLRGHAGHVCIERPRFDKY